MTISSSVVTDQMVELLDRLTPHEGYNLTALADVRFLRSNRPLMRTPVLYEPGIVIVVQGRKRGFLGNDVYLYDAQHYLMVSIPVPFTMETDASALEPMLAIYMRLDFTVAADLLLHLADRGQSASVPPRSMVSSPMDDAMSHSVLRFLQIMASPLDAEILGQAMVREIYYRVLTGVQGQTLRSALTLQGQFGKVAKALRKLHAEYDSYLDVNALAKEAGMSLATFHSHFKTITETSPMQYLKSTRLHQARLLMLRNNLTASAASARVGYESVSQFSREFKRLFGLTPISEVARMKQNFSLPAPVTPSDFISSH
ncbi:AraC family transcriptional regulator [Serratia grimesii]|uniref:AraC family transcriptional regulator n=1 Tax=Serratia grimesii TaxID=82995 RepID=UPI00077C995E|nr:AraC family transcriptional regulator [Serratia grimesii]CAI1149495.1 L-rhamnose operon regulatory protein rhaS [Serratia grimesii]CAI2524193.1 L-rhamnose operon regulatory protein rhaS [Serratia grimesii]SUI36341.1 L-rhamnose operon regulatory protein rhaS [Serratia grimesii]